ncbi:MAG: rubrerythrin family protein [Oscillospiraceae bacterium]|nr:rubrerythrin family protein [Oscillospiraceae bacterium]MBQ3049474.1 rubrerythrin family protein [Oscillospiraceae bacterium]MBQ9939418.1 rubrerythrin family protein [Oscillospiraceae bacterium]
MELRNSLTFQNLINAFAGETQAHVRYQLLAATAKDKGLFELEKTVQVLVRNEYTHARMFYTAIQSADTNTFANLNVCSGYPFKEKWDFVKNFEFAAQNENDEANFIYPSFAQTAKDEGLTNIADLFERIAQVENCHMNQLNELRNQLQDSTMYNRATPVKWKCSECGYEETLNQAWDICPLCKSPQGYVMLELPE